MATPGTAPLPFRTTHSISELRGPRSTESKLAGVHTPDIEGTASGWEDVHKRGLGDLGWELEEDVVSALLKTNQISVMGFMSPVTPPPPPPPSNPPIGFPFCN